MTDSAAVAGDGILTIPVNALEDFEMSTPGGIDIPAGVGQMMMVETTGNIQASNRNSRGVFDAVMGALAGTVQTNFAEVGTLESKAAQGIYGTPLASPVVKS